MFLVANHFLQKFIFFFTSLGVFSREFFQKVFQIKYHQCSICYKNHFLSSSIENIVNIVKSLHYQNITIRFAQNIKFPS